KSRDAQGVWYPDDYDIRRLVSVSGGVPLIAGWELSGKWRLVGGRPYTLLPIRPNDVGGYDLDPDFEARNTVRYPDYRRLDLRIDRRLELGGWGVSLFLEVQNVTNRDNVYAWQFDRVDGELKPILQFQRLTIMGIIADF
ncbi:TonB-dependent receptor, partial [Candidatus Poribacteria bacterium]|nr:TonB-dependent receptor [Candidatus Poribacteria bacterium]